TKLQTVVPPGDKGVVVYLEDLAPEILNRCAAAHSPRQVCYSRGSGRETDSRGEKSRRHAERRISRRRVNSGRTVTPKIIGAVFGDANRIHDRGAKNVRLFRDDTLPIGRKLLKFVVESQGAAEHGAVPKVSCEDAVFARN